MENEFSIDRRLNFLEWSEHELPALALPSRYNYVGVFLTLRCNSSCSYCINRFGVENECTSRYAEIDAGQWLHGLNRLHLPPDIPITLQGGEPTLHDKFYEIVDGIKPETNIDLLTNLQFDVDEFMERVAPERLRRDAPYASIRISYHPEATAFDSLLRKTRRLQDKGYSVGIWAISHPHYRTQIQSALRDCEKAGVDFRVKEFLGYLDGRLHGNYRYRRALDGKEKGCVACRTTELLLAPDGGVYRCHSDLYNRRETIGQICDENFVVEDVFRRCRHFGACNPCDVKIKTDRFQHYGHTSVELMLSDECGDEHAECGRTNGD